MPSRTGWWRVTAAAAAATLGAFTAAPGLPSSTAAALSRGPARSGAGAPARVVDCRVTKCVALTFDDGPTQYTAALLDTLER